MDFVSKYRPLKHYHWGEGGRCEGWILVDESGLSVKLEKMPPHTSEQKHMHRVSQQFFYILKGIAVFEIENEQLELQTNQGIHIPAGKQHKVINEGEEDLELLLSSQPAIGNDRINKE
jgi:mannose-6-phosphate isomerase-like protein (cupin superfamily)